PSTGSPQAGLNFGFNENYYVKLVVLNGNTIQLKKEIDSKSMSGLNNADNITVENLDLDGKNVSLRITFDLTSATISGSYAVNGGGFMPLSSAGKSALELPETLLVGRINPNELAGASLAGIFASYNNASATFDTTFDYFNINEVTLLSTATVKESLAKIKIYPNPVQENLNIVIPDQESGIKTISLYDLQGRLIRNYAPQRIKTNMGYRLATGNLSVGVYVIQLKNSNGNTAQIKFIKSK
ncbi:MAG TPA: T9SS type A sorting domain-containing protein, partial [Leeuwenhoekiella sp.]|nr:T9SS type A sorting domain-containing protein [Leeuwenhoekiella sp.]